MAEVRPLNVTVFGNAEEGALEQIKIVMQDERAVMGALMADNHQGYSMPIGGVVAYDKAISPTGVGFDIGCGNKAVMTDLNVFSLGVEDISASDGHMMVDQKALKGIMREIQRTVAFGLGRKNPTPVDHELFDEDVWPWLESVAPGLKDKAREQLGTVGSGNHYVDLLVDESGRIWIANHFGSRGLGHTICTGFLHLDEGREFTARGNAEKEYPVVFDTDSEIGAHYIACMQLAGAYAYAGRDYVIDQVLGILGATALESVHNHHNYAWLEDGYWVVRKGATPLTREPAFIGGSMGDISVIVRGKIGGWSGQPLPPPATAVEDIGALASAPHGAGRVMSRTKAAGKLRKMWYCGNHNCDFVPIRSQGDNTTFEKNRCPKCNLPLRKGRMRDTSDAAIDWDATRADLAARGIVVLGAGADEAPGVYKQLEDVLQAHSNIEVLHSLRPIGVVMAGPDERDPYKD